jgi:hypothetical protein
VASRGWENVTLAEIGMKAFPKQGKKAAGVPQVKRSKYRAIRTEVNGFVFASKREAARYRELLVLGAEGKLRDLELQPRFPIVLNGRTIATYIADFRYQTVPWDYEPVENVVEDVKGMKTPVYNLKKKLVEAQYNIQIREIR